MTEAQGVELLEKVGTLVEQTDHLKAQLDFLGTANAFLFLALCTVLFFVMVGALRRS